MNFAWTDEQQQFRAQVREFLATHLPEGWEEIAHGPGSSAQTHFSKQFCGELAAAGLLVPHWPAPSPISTTWPATSAASRCGVTSASEPFSSPFPDRETSAVCR